MLSWVCIALLVTVFSSLVTGQAWSEPGDVILGLVLPIHDTNVSMRHAYDIRYACGDLNAEMTLRVSFFRRWIAQVKLPGGMKLGYNIIDSCDLPNIAIAYASVWTKAKLERDNSDNNCVSLAIGTKASKVTGPLATYLQLFDIPLIDFEATASDLSNRMRYSRFLRTVPPDTFQAKALVDLAKALNFTCVHLVYSRQLYGEGGAEDVRAELKRQGICKASDHKAPDLLNPNDLREFDEIVEAMAENPEVSGVICFCEASTIEGILVSLQYLNSIRPNATRFMMLASDYWGTRVYPNLEKEAEAAISIALYSSGSSSENRGRISMKNELPWINNQIRWIYRQDPWFQEFLKSKLHCSFDPGDRDRNFCNSRNLTLTARDLPFQNPASLYNFRLAFDVAVEGLREMIQVECVGQKLGRDECSKLIVSQSSKLYFDYLSNVKLNSFEFVNETGDGPALYDYFNYRRKGFGPFFINRYEYKHLGMWTATDGVKVDQHSQQWKFAKMWAVYNSNVTITSNCQCNESEIYTSKDAES